MPIKRILTFAVIFAIAALIWFVLRREPASPAAVAPSAETTTESITEKSALSDEDDAAKRTAVTDARAVILATSNTGPRKLAELVTWLARGDVRNSCDKPQKYVPYVRLDDPTEEKGFGQGKGFLYDLKTAQRLCEPLMKKGKLTKIIDGRPDVHNWWMANGKPSAIVPLFYEGSRFGQADWIVVSKAQPSGPKGILVEVKIRHKTDPYRTSREFQLFVPECIRLNKDKECTKESLETPYGQVSINEFYWVRLMTADEIPPNSGATIGDLILLRNFHFVEKRNSTWLWSTFWWDMGSKDFKAPLDLYENGNKAAGTNPEAWNNYAMDATYGCSRTVFNPNREADNTSNCASCHRQARMEGSGLDQTGGDTCKPPNTNPGPVYGTLDSVFVGEKFPSLK